MSTRSSLSKNPLLVRPYDAFRRVQVLCLPDQTIPDILIQVHQLQSNRKVKQEPSQRIRTPEDVCTLEQNAELADRMKCRSHTQRLPPQQLNHQ
mmetsp:Transcript_55534/g.113333  ORF Transcript_55534/g.113333 Transcript_55534/m.113333 type:complete len:94 (-) Transcript_55534:567-848(-)